MSREPPVREETAPIMRMVVDLPAPFGPRSPKDSPGATSKERPSTATWSPYFFTRRSAVMTGVGTSPQPRDGRGFLHELNLSGRMRGG
ncbi:hypothetical protein BC477_16400 [Clavibacter michiganensis subsp. michiganensis]|uniref:Uncharacterized protein n=1 Tax=Clavibacter michiganensis subsp. michiganensis TaxID=33013 RepID=A0A251XEP1_CLAMM|nr:hypothetical protein BC477_16400 [Clavibacter michiganensis subsp. michiganensis]OUE00510.1 hypothetical protein CMMCAS07_19100 [Clavibacter michiganensis subsp. michiganensis]